MPVYTLLIFLVFHLSLPQIQSFKLTNPVSGQFVHAGVLNFLSPSRDEAHLPQWMMDHLRAEEGDEMIFEHVDLEPGTFVKLQPISSTWLVSTIYLYVLQLHIPHRKCFDGELCELQTIITINIQCTCVFEYKVDQC